ncbi:hypothetical protein Aduo_007657 [Ancylostoma duodenale]
MVAVHDGNHIGYIFKCFDLPGLPSNNLSVSFYNVPTALLMRWMVGEPTDQQKEEMAHVLTGEQKHPTMGSPFKSAFFIILFIAGLLMSLTIPVFAILIFLWRRKKEASYAQQDDVIFFVLSGVLIAASVLTGLFALILILNNEKITEKPAQLVNRFSIYKRVEEHKEKLLCIMDHSFESHKEQEVQQNANNPKVEKMATVLLNTFGAEEILRRKQKVDGIIKSIKSKAKDTNEALEEMNQLLKLEISRNSLVTTLLSIYESEPVEDKGEITNFKRVMEKTVEELAVELEHYQSKAAEVVLKNTPHAISWIAVMFAMLIACLFVVVKTLFVVRICALSHVKPASTGSSLYSQESFTVDIVKRMSIRCVTTSIAILGVVMFVLFICGAYNGFIMMLRGKSVPGGYQAFRVMNLSLADDHRYDLSLSEFFEKCKEGSNLIDAFGTWRFLDSEFMQKLGLNLDHARKSAAKPNLKKFTGYIENLIKQVEVLRLALAESDEMAIETLLNSSLRLDPKAVAKHANAEGDFKKLSDALKKVEHAPILPSFSNTLSCLAHNFPLSDDGN